MKVIMNCLVKQKDICVYIYVSIDVFIVLVVSSCFRMEI